MFAAIKKLFDPNVGAISKVEPIVDQTLALEAEVKELSFAKMRERVDAMRAELQPLIAKIPAEDRESIKSNDHILRGTEKEIHAKLQEFLPQFYAFMREVNNRKLHKPHFRVQLIAATILAQGQKLTELKTGEGKTQVFQLPAALYGLTGRGSHVVTVNDYLARRDAEYAGHAMADLGISVGVITPQASYKFVPDEQLAATKGEEAAAERKTVDIASLSNMHGINLVECTKQDAYAQDVVYGTNNEFGFDYLRDNMAYEVSERVQRELYYCIVDEADSILIDEARTPLIISAPAEASNDLYVKFAGIVKQLTPEKHFVVDEKAHSATLNEDGVLYVEKLLGVSNLWEDYQLAHHIDNALKAQALYKIDDHYLVKNGEVLIVDEFTGRVLPGRRYSEGLHQAIEAKEGVEIKRESKTLATITFQNFFKLYKILAGGSGTIITEAEEFLKIYGLESYVIPTNRKLVRDDRNEKIYKSRLAKFTAVVEEINKVHQTGQPILVGTATIEDSEYLSSLLDKRGIQHEVLNAKFHEREAAIVAKAGEKNGVTVATNMAGRGTDIPLGEGVKELGGLYIMGTERHEARRIDNQLRGRAGRQGDPGTTQFFVALDDEIMRIQGGDIVKRLMEMTKIPDDIPIESGLIGGTIENAQKKMEGYHFDMRKRVVDYDNVMNQQREVYYARRFNIVKAAADKTDEGLANLKKIIIEILLQQVNYLVQKNYDETGLNIKTTVNEFLDLAEDEQIVKAYNELYDQKTSLIDLKNALLATKGETLQEELEKIITKVAEHKLNEFGADLGEIYKVTALQTMDELWTEHLDAMTDLREGIGLRGYAQRDPLVEYKNEAFGYFEGFVNKINSQVASRILKIRHITAPTVIPGEIRTNADQVSDILTGSRELGLNASAGEISTPRQAIKKDVVGRNDPCPCGSGLKYKRCGLINSPEHRKHLNAK